MRQPAVFFLVPERFKIQEMCIKAVEVDPWQLGDVPYHIKAQEMCDKAVWEDPSSLKYVPGWFATREGLYMCHDDYYDDDGNYWDDDDKCFKWYDGHKKRKAQKVQIKKELMPIAGHPSRWWAWCMSENEKKETEKLFLTI